jgi:hypothetical protein
MILIHPEVRDYLKALSKNEIVIYRTTEGSC